MSQLRAIATFSGLTMVSRIFGFIRDILLANFLGTEKFADVFIVAFKLPNFFRRLFAEGAFNAAFVPLFCAELEKGETPARRFAEEALAVLLTVLLALTFAFEAAMPWVMYVLAPGFADDPERYDLAVQFTRATFPYLMLISLVSLFAGVMNSLRRFAAAAAAPIILNLTLISSLLLFHESEFIAGRTLATAVSVAGLLQLVWMAIWMSRAGMRLRLLRPRLTAAVRRLVRIMMPAALGAGAVQVNLIVDIILASFLPVGSLSYLFYADRLNQLPIGVIGVAVGTVLLPSLSAMLAKGDKDAAQEEQGRAIETALLLTLPAAFALAAIPEALIGTIFQHGQFDADGTTRTAAALMAYAAGLPAYVLIKALTPAFYARHDTATPVKVAVVALVVNIVLNLILMGPLLHVGLALATAIAAWLNAGTLYWLLHRRGHYRLDGARAGRIARLLLAAALMAAALMFLQNILSEAFAGALMSRVAALAGLVLAGILVYFALVGLLGVGKWDELKRILGRRA